MTDIARTEPNPIANLEDVHSIAEILKEEGIDLEVHDAEGLVGTPLVLLGFYKTLPSNYEGTADYSLYHFVTEDEPNVVRLFKTSGVLNDQLRKLHRRAPFRFEIEEKHSGQYRYFSIKF